MADCSDHEQANGGSAEDPGMSKLSRRRFLQSGATAAGLAALAPMSRFEAAHAQEEVSEPSGGMDVVILGGTLIDGSGGPAQRGDVGIVNGRLVGVGGDLSRVRAQRTIEAQGKVVCPGFIDLHSHATSRLRDDNPDFRAAPNMVMDGITTALVNPDGSGEWPISGQLRAMRELGTGPNVMVSVPHNTVRRRVLGTDRQREATPDEVEQMRELVKEGMEQGAWGLSAGLEYTSGRWSTTDEVVSLVEEIVPFEGFYISHQRSEGRDPLWFVLSEGPPDPPTVIDAVEETIEIGERTGGRVVATHIKTKAPWWHRSDEVIGLIENARSRGVDVWADLYSYDTTGSDGNVVLIPGWVFSGDGDPADQLEAVLEDPELAEVLDGDVQHEIEKRGHADQISILDYPDPGVIGQSLQELADDRDVSPVEMVYLLQSEGDREAEGGGRMRAFSLHEDDVEAFMQMPWAACASDGGIELLDGGQFVHPRRYGNFARRLRRYALDRGVISLEFAIHSATGLPAQIAGIRNRGLLRSGRMADVLVFDPDRVQDKSTVEDPHQYNEGIEHVLVGGQAVVDGGEPTWALAGQPLTLLDRDERDPTEPAQYFTDFSDLTPGDPPPNWTTWWRESNWTVLDGPPRLQHNIESSGRRALTWDEVGQVVGDVEIFAMVRGSSSNTLFTVPIHVDGEADLEIAYYIDVRRDSGVMRLCRFNYEFHATLDSVSFTPEENVWYRALLRRQGHTLQGKVWRDGSTEPDWMVTADDYEFNGGAVGIGGYQSASTTEWARVGVGTGGLTAPRE